MKSNHEVSREFGFFLYFDSYTDESYEHFCLIYSILSDMVRKETGRENEEKGTAGEKWKGKNSMLVAPVEVLFMIVVLRCTSILDTSKLVFQRVRAAIDNLAKTVFGESIPLKKKI